MCSVIRQQYFCFAGSSDQAEEVFARLKEENLERRTLSFTQLRWLVAFSNTTNPIPASIEIKTNTNIQTIVEYIQDMPGIAHISTHINSNPYELYIQRIMKK